MPHIVKVKLLFHKGARRGGGKAPRIPDFGTNCKWMAIITLWHLYLRGNKPTALNWLWAGSGL